MNLIQFLWPTIIIVIFLINIRYIGGTVSNYITGKNKDFSIVLGFVLFVAVFHLIALPFLYVSGRFEPLYYAFLVFFAITSFFAIKDLIQNLKTIKWKKYNTIVLAVAIFYGLYLFLFSVPYIDSWLYLPLSQISGETGYIYSTAEQVPVTNWIHIYDSYYVLINCFAKLSNIDTTFFIITFFKFTEGFIIVYSFAFFTKILFKNYRLAFYLSFAGLLFWIPVLTNQWSMNYAYTSVFMVQMTSNGTAIIFHILLPLLLIFQKYKNSIKNPDIVFLVLTIFGFACSSSALYLIPFYIVAVVAYDLIFHKEGKAKFALLSIFFVAVELLIYVNILELYLMVFVIICGSIVIYTINKYIGKRLEMLLAVSIILAYVVSIIVIFIWKDLSIYDAITQNLKAVMRPLLLILGAIYFYKENKQTTFFILVGLFLFSNPFAIHAWMNTPLWATYNRVEMISMYYLFYIAGAMWIIEYLSITKYHKIAIYTFLGIAFAWYSTHIICFNNENEAMSIRDPRYYENFYEYKMLYSEVYNFGTYPYEPNATLQIPQIDVVYTRTYGQPDFYGVKGMNPTITITDYIGNCTSNCYIIQPAISEDPSGYAVVDTSKDYELLFKK